MMLPILISVSVAPGSYFFWAIAPVLVAANKIMVADSTRNRSRRAGTIDLPRSAASVLGTVADLPTKRHALTKLEEQLRPVNQGATPSVTVTAIGREVSLSWGASTLSNGAAVGGYRVERYPSGGGVGEISPIGTCSGTVAATSCAEEDVPPGSWVYTVTPAIGNWRGAESASSGVVTMGAAGAPTTEIRMLNIEKLRGRPVQQRRYYFMVHHGRLWEAQKDFLDWMERS